MKTEIYTSKAVKAFRALAKNDYRQHSKKWVNHGIMVIQEDAHLHQPFATPEEFADLIFGLRITAGC